MSIANSLLSVPLPILKFPDTNSFKAKLDLSQIDIPNWDSENDELTISLWVKLESPGDTAIFSIVEDSDKRLGFYLRQSENDESISSLALLIRGDHIKCK